MIQCKCHRIYDKEGASNLFLKTNTSFKFVLYFMRLWTKACHLNIEKIRLFQGLENGKWWTKHYFIVLLIITRLKVVILPLLCRGSCSKAGELVSKTDWGSSILSAPATNHRTSNQFKLKKETRLLRSWGYGIMVITIALQAINHVSITCISTKKNFYFHNLRACRQLFKNELFFKFSGSQPILPFKSIINWHARLKK